MKPNFFIVGAPKAGTTALYRQLQMHPDVYMPSFKEPSFFSEKKKSGGGEIKTLVEYEDLFASAGSEKAIGEASVSYLHSEQAPLALYDYCSKAKIVVLLRQPVLRAYSHYRMLLNNGIAKYTTFTEASDVAMRHIQHDTPIPYGTGYRQSFYADALQRYLDLFPGQVLVLEHQQYRQNPERTFREVLAFLDVDTSYTPDTLSKAYNTGSGAPRSLLFQKLLFSQSGFKHALKSLVPERLQQEAKKWIFRLNRTERKQLQQSDVLHYTEVFHDDIRKTEISTGLDLSHWKSLPHLGDGNR